MNIQDIMTRNPAFSPPDAALEQAAQRMRDEDLIASAGKPTIVAALEAGAKHAKA